MTSSADEVILGAFKQAAGASAVSATDSGSLSLSSDALTNALTGATQAINVQIPATSANTSALTQGTTSRGTSGASDALRTATEFLGGGLSLMPIASLISSLFSAGEAPQPALVPYSLPPSLKLQTTTNSQSVDWGENGLPRAAATPAVSTTPQITVQVQAMDSQSFLDHSNDIAQAVRQAMLNMNSLNDVVTNL